MGIDLQQAWRNFLTQRGVTIETRDGVERAVSASPIADAPNTQCVDLSHLTAMRLVGPDATTFLQGYLTCDMRALSAEHALLGAYTNIKGRVVADAIVSLTDGHPTLIVHASLREKIVESLKKYLTFSRSRFAPADDAPILLGLVNAPTDPALPTEPLTVLPFRGGSAIALPGPTGRVLLALPPDAAMDTWIEYETRGLATDATPWEWIDLRGGIVRVQAATSEEFLPQMLDYDRLGAVSFTKGCYLGQEIIARTQHLGRPKRHLHALAWRGAGDLPHVGQALLTSAGSRAGTIVASVAVEPDHGEALAVLNDAVEGPLHAGAFEFAIR